MQKLIMTVDDKIADEELQHYINREAAKISAWSSWEIDKNEYLTGDEILPSNQKEIIKQAKSKYSPLAKSFKKQTKTNEKQREKQIKTVEGE